MIEIVKYVFDRLKAERPVTVKVGDQDYAVESNGTLGRAVRELAPQWDAPTFTVGTLQGLVELFNAKVDGLTESVALNISDYRKVQLVSVRADDFGRRHVYAEAQHKGETPFVFDKFYTSPEEFLIAFRASFYFNDEAVKVQQLCSAVGAGEAVAVSDDGISQEVVVKSGTVTKSAVQLPADGVNLIPWRTFREVDPVQSKFLLRMKGVKDGLPQIALFEIDARWRLDTIGAVALWLKAALPGLPVIA